MFAIERGCVTDVTALLGQPIAGCAATEHRGSAPKICKRPGMSCRGGGDGRDAKSIRLTPVSNHSCRRQAIAKRAAAARQPDGKLRSSLAFVARRDYGKILRRVLSQQKFHVSGEQQAL